MNLIFILYELIVHNARGKMRVTGTRVGPFSTMDLFPGYLTAFVPLLR